MKKRLLTMLLTITMLGSGFGAAYAQQIDAGAPLTEMAPALDGSENAATELATASDVVVVEASASTRAEEPGAIEAGGEMYAAIRAGKWIIATGFGLVLLVGLLRRFGPGIIKGRKAGYVLGYGIPLLAALGLSMTTGTWSLEIFIAAIAVGQSGAAWHSSGQDIKREPAGKFP